MNLNPKIESTCNLPNKTTEIVADISGNHGGSYGNALRLIQDGNDDEPSPQQFYEEALKVIESFDGSAGQLPGLVPQQEDRACGNER